MRGSVEGLAMCQRMLEPGVPDQFTMQLCQRLLATPSFPSLGFLTTDLDDVCVCVTLGIIGVLLDLLSLLSHFPVLPQQGAWQLFP